MYNINSLMENHFRIFQEKYKHAKLLRDDNQPQDKTKDMELELE